MIAPWLTSPRYGDYMPPMPELDGVAIGAPVEDAWWLHPELAEELAFLRKLKRLNMKISVVLNKMDILREMDVNVEEFTLRMREQINSDLGKTKDGQDILENLWPTSVLKDPSSLAPLTQWLCETLPKQSPIYPLENISDVPARVVASELTREKLFAVLREEVPYHLTVVNVVWRQEADGKLLLGQKAAGSEASCGVTSRAPITCLVAEILGKERTCKFGGWLPSNGRSILLTS